MRLAFEPVDPREYLALPDGDAGSPNPGRAGIERKEKLVASSSCLPA